jgi:hypothetical protein
MNAGPLRTSSGQSRYAQTVILCLLALGIGIAVLVYYSHQRIGRPDLASEESLGEHLDIEQKLLRDLAKRKNRTFTDEQVTTFKRELSPLKGERIAIECAMGDLKSCYLALELNLVFEASGWIVEEFLFAAQATPGKAVILRVRDPSKMPRAEDLSRLLVSAGLSVSTQIDREQLFDLKILVPSEDAQTAPETPA